MTQPLLSVVVVNWNAKDFIVGCIQSIFASDYKNLEIILVDNHSEDGSIEFLRKSLAFEVLSKIKIIVNDKNFGAAYALDQGAELAKGKYLTFIATDTKVERECFSQLANLFESDRTIGGASSKLLMMDDHKRIDSAGEYLNQFGLLMQRHAGFEIDRGQFSEVADIFGVKGTALTVRRDVFSEVGGYPKDYFMFLEETDLCWRIWLSGKRIVFLPNAVIYHASGVSINSHKHSSYLVKYYGSRNYIFTLAKNLGTWQLIKILPLHILMWLSLAFLFVLKGRAQEAIYITKGVFWNFTHLGNVLKQRSLVQKKRKVNDKVLMPKILRKVKFSYLFDRVGMW